MAFLSGRMFGIHSGIPDQTPECFQLSTGAIGHSEMDGATCGVDV
jgi:hypothetical protein